MEYMQVGNADLKISRIGFGCMSLKPDRENEAIELLQMAVDMGINYFDTADLYDKGWNETLVGKALKGKDVIIATKVGNQWRADGSGWDWNPRKEYILKEVEESLKRLQTTCIDLYQLHGGTIEDPVDETIEAFELLKTQGKIRYYGISSIRPNVIREFVKRSSIVSVLTQYSMADRRPEESTLGLLHKNHIGVISRGALAQGLLVNKPAKDYLGHSASDIQQAVSFIHSISDSTRSAAQTAIQFVLKHPALTSAIIGIRTAEHLKEAVGAINAKQLTESEYEELQKILPAKQYADHR